MQCCHSVCLIYSVIIMSLFDTQRYHSVFVLYAALLKCFSFICNVIIASLFDMQR